MLSKACEYAIKAMIFIESCSKTERKISLPEIAEAIGSPAAYTSKVLQQLRKNKFLNSTIGARGGFRIPKKRSINLAEIIHAIDGDIFNQCVLGLPTCSSKNPCPLHEKYREIKESQYKLMLESCLSKFSSQLQKSCTSLK